MTDEQELSSDSVIRAVRQVLKEFAPDIDDQDVEEFVETLKGNDPEEREVNLGAGFGQYCEDIDGAFERYAELIGAVEVRNNPIPKPEADK